MIPTLPQSPRTMLEYSYMQQQATSAMTRVTRLAREKLRKIRYSVYPSEANIRTPPGFQPRQLSYSSITVQPSQMPGSSLCIVAAITEPPFAP